MDFPRIARRAKLDGSRRLQFAKSVGDRMTGICMPGTVFATSLVDRDMGRDMKRQRSMAEQQDQQQGNLALTIDWHDVHNSAI